MDAMDFVCYETVADMEEELLSHFSDVEELGSDCDDGMDSSEFQSFL